MTKFYFFSFLQYLYEMLCRFAALPHQEVKNQAYGAYETHGPA